MSTEDLTQWQSCNEQDFEINLTIQDNIYHYTLVVEHDRDCRRMRIAKERLTHNDKPILTLQTAMPSFTMMIIPKDSCIASIGLVQVLTVWILFTCPPVKGRSFLTNRTIILPCGKFTCENW